MFLGNNPLFYYSNEFGVDCSVEDEGIMVILYRGGAKGFRQFIPEAEPRE